MRILFLSQLIPFPTDAGPKVRIYHVLQYLAAAGHQVTLVAFRRDTDQPADIAHTRQFCADLHTVTMGRSRARDAWELARSLLESQPFLIKRDSVRAMYRKLEELQARQSFDAIHADQLWMAQYALAAKAMFKESFRVKTTLDQHNAVHLIPRRLAKGTRNPVKKAILASESRSLARYEVAACQMFDHVVWVTEQDQKAVSDQWAKNNGNLASDDHLLRTVDQSIIPICIDPQEKAVIQRDHHPNRVTFLGGLHWPPNADGVRWFVREIWPHVLQQVPEAVFTIIGKSPPPDIASQSSQIERVEVTGYVADPIPYLKETAVFIVPLRAGGGMRVKIVDAWSWGLPVVSTRIGAEGIHYKDGENLLIADEAKTFARVVTRLLRQPVVAAGLGQAGRNTVESQYDWRKVYPAWDAVYKAT